MPRYSGHRGPSTGKINDLVKRGVDGIEEFNAKAYSTALVPTSRLAVFGVGLVFKANAQSPLAQFSFGAGADIFPRNAMRLPGHNATRSFFNLSGPGGLHFGRVLGAWFVKTGQEFGGDISAFVDRQCQRFSKKLLRSGRHMAILDAAVQPNKRLHPTAAAKRNASGRG